MPKFIAHLLLIALGIGLLGKLSLNSKIVPTKISQSQRPAAAAVITVTSTPMPTITPTPTPTLDSLIRQSQSVKNNSYGYCQYAPILMYHHVEPQSQAVSEGHGWMNVDPAIFEQQMQYLNSRGYATISVDQLADSLLGHQNLGPKKILITMDDGYSDIKTYAYPILQKYHIIANLMIPTGLMNNPGYLNWNDLSDMIHSGLIFAYDHTWSHASMGMADFNKAQYEILTAKKQLEDHLGGKVDIFAYPYGSYNETAGNILRTNGFRAALSTIPGVWQCDSFILDLHRTRVGNAPLSSYGF